VLLVRKIACCARLLATAGLSGAHLVMHNLVEKVAEGRCRGVGGSRDQGVERRRGFAAALI
jgi:hypothetical protein